MNFFIKNLFLSKEKLEFSTNSHEDYYKDYNEKIKLFHEELNKTINYFNIDLNKQTDLDIKTHGFNLNSEKFGIVSNNIKIGTFDNKEQVFKCVQINPYLKPIDFENNNISNKIDLQQIKKEEKIDYELNKVFDINIDFGDFSELNLDTDDKLKSKYILAEPSGLFGLFHLAYANHKNIFIRPDDLWFHIVLQLQMLIDNNPEEVRDCFVEHKGKKEINIDINMYSKESFIDFITGSNLQMKNNVKNDFVQITNTIFSTTSNFDLTLSKISTMCAMKHYFSFTCSETCGIRNIFFGGKLEDWVKIKTNLVLIANYQKEILSNYINKVIPIVDKFIEAIETKPDIEFFNKVMREDASLAGEFSLGYGDGSEITKYVDGWIRDLYSSMNNSNRLLPSDFEEYKCDCDFELEKCDGTKQTKTISTSTGIGFKFHEDSDGFSLVKAWWVCDKVNRSESSWNLMNFV